jgi:hypothetical protein
MHGCRFNLRIVLVALLLVHGAALQAAEIDRAKAAAVMAAYVRHIASYTQWPGDASSADQPIRIGLIGADPNRVIAPIRARTESGEGLVAQGRPIQVVVLGAQSVGDAGFDELSACDLLFISAEAEEDWRRVQPLIEALPIVTVSEMEGFVNRAGMVEFYIERRSGKIRIKVNLPAMRDAGISFSSQFLTSNSVILLDGGEEA